MHKGLTHATLGVLGAALLSGSVFAAGPELQGLPDVIISDRVSSGVLVDQNDTELYDAPSGVSAVTNNIYRFTDAFDLTNFVSYAGATNEVRWDFVQWTPSDEVNSGTAETAAGQNITINGNYGATDEPDYADLTGTGYDLSTDSVLSFVNTYRSGGDGTVSGPAWPADSFTDMTDLSIYVASTDASSAPNIDADRFTVYTTNNEEVDLGLDGTPLPNPPGDQLSAATSIFQPVADYEVLNGWFVDQIAEFPNYWEASGIDFTFLAAGALPSVSPAPNVPVNASNQPAAPAERTLTDSGADTLSIGTLASPGSTGTGTDTSFIDSSLVGIQLGIWYSWRRDLDSLGSVTGVEAQNQAVFPVSEGNVYMARWNVTGTPLAQPEQSGDVRFRMGSPTGNVLGQAVSQLIGNGANTIVSVSPVQHLSFFYAHGTDYAGLYWDIFDLWNGNNGYTNGHADYSATVHSVEILSFDPASLTGEQVVLNQGQASISDPEAPASPTQFTSDKWEPALTINGTTRQLTTNYASLPADTLTFSINQAGNEPLLGSWETQVARDSTPSGDGQFDNTLPELITGIRNDELVRIDWYFSSPQGNDTNNHLPTIRFGLSSSFYGGSTGQSTAPLISQGRFAWHEFIANNRTLTYDSQPLNEVGEPVAQLMSLTTTPQRYSVFMTPNLHGAPADSSTLDGFLKWDTYSFPIGGLTVEDVNMRGTVTLNRVVVRKYDLPADARTTQLGR